MRRVLYNTHAPDDVYAIIREAVPPGFELVVLERDSDDERRVKIADCDVVIVGATPLGRSVIEHAHRLTLVHHQGVGWQDTTDHGLLRERGVPLAITPEGTTTGVAEHTVLLMLAIAKRLPFADAELRQGRFHMNALRPVSRELAGLTVGYIGMGRIAQAVAQRLAPFDTHGIFCDPAVEQFADLRRVGFDDVLREADILTLHVPLTPQTRHCIGREQVARMKPGAFLINTARGGLVDEHALADALRDGRLAGAALDVFEREPVAPDNPLLALPNVVLTPHIAAGTRDALRTKMAALFANVERFYRGEPLRNRVL
ncbi:MAG TPA: 2-hydroxyacid dehydrogenase [Burkholderiaceae bacterium]|jgi:phosphoglycerate dehydrogenase-like enzyme|nr:2-hydroxyacid dehydrogenase [Burkholderiaceae bacterium]